MTIVEISCAEYGDFPRIFITKWHGKVILFDGHFDYDLEDYGDTFAVYELPPTVVEHLSGRNWLRLGSEGRLIGRISVNEVKFPGKDKRRKGLWTEEPREPGTKERIICWMDDEIFKKLGID